MQAFQNIFKNSSTLKYFEYNHLLELFLGVKEVYLSNTAVIIEEDQYFNSIYLV